jgi:hypothetical protein
VDGTLTNAADAVLAMQGDNGCWPNLFGPGDDPYSTTDAIQLLALAAEAPFGLDETATSTGSVQAADADPEPTAEPTPEPLPTNTPLPPLSDDPNRAALVIVLEDGLTVERCVAFDEPQISGYDLLQRADLDLVVDVSGAGAAVCAIEGTGCPADDCFCECSGADCVYWAYWYQQDGQWQYAQVGAASYQVNPARFRPGSGGRDR